MCIRDRVEIAQVLTRAGWRTDLGQPVTSAQVWRTAFHVIDRLVWATGSWQGHLLERRSERLHGKREAIENGGEQKAFEGKGQRMPDELVVKPSERAVRPDGDKNIKSQHRRRQHQWELSLIHI